MEQAKVNRVLPRECTGHSKHRLATTQQNSTQGHHQMINTEMRLIIFFAGEDACMNAKLLQLCLNLQPYGQ